MDDLTERSRRYLLGDLSEAERATFEEAYFSNPSVFAEVAEAENELVDDYVRGRLSLELRERFEQIYLADPTRRERVRFAEALVARVDAPGLDADRVNHATAEPVDREAAPSRSPNRQSWIAPLLGPSSGYRLAFASLLALAVAGAVWLFLQSNRSSPAPERATVEPPPAVVTPTPSNRTAPAPDPLPPVSPVTPVTLALTLGAGVRSVEPSGPLTLAIPTGTSEVRLVLTLRDLDYPSYRVLLRAIGGAEILRQGDLKPSPGRAGAELSLVVPASRFSAGDYLLTLQGATSGGEFEDVSQALFRVR